MYQIIELLRGSGEIEAGAICAMNQMHLNDLNEIWKPMLKALDQDDAFWDWMRKKRLSLTMENYEAYAIEQDSLTQGLLWIETQNHRSQRPRGQPLVYVEAIATAPWNRRSLNPEPYFRGIGTLLLNFARKRSLDLGYGGRLGLHALPGAASFYESQNMADFGADPDYEDMIYFEYGLIYPLEREVEDYEY